MKDIDIKLFAAQEGNAWFRAGWNALVNNYREYQCAVQEDRGRPNSASPPANRSGHMSALEVLVYQVADALSLPPSDVGDHLKGYLYEACGSPKSPKGLDERNRPRS